MFLGSVYWRTGDPDGVALEETAMFSMVAMQFMSLVFLGILNMQTVIPIITNERASFYREQAANMYPPGAYNLVLGLCETPFLLFTSMLFCSIFYFMTGLNEDADKFFFWWLFFMAFTSTPPATLMPASSSHVLGSLSQP